MDLSGTSSLVIPATSVPPPVNSTGDVGTDPTKFALADHTHKSSMWAGTLPTDTTGKAVFTFMSGFFDAPPVISVDVENSDPTILYNRAVTGKTKDGVTVTVRKVTTIVAGLLTVSTPAAGLVVNLIARRAST